MGLYTEYLDKRMDWPSLANERKKQLQRIQEIRGGRALIVFASAITKVNDPIGIDYNDRVPFFDQLNELDSDKIDIILETPGGQAEIVEDLITQIRLKFKEVAMIIPSYAKSAGTIMVMAGDEILMEPSSALGPIDAQIIQGGKRYSVHAFLEGLKKIREEVEKTKKLNIAYVPILQNISPGEIQTCENLLNFSSDLVTRWLTEYKFKYWDIHSSTGKKVTTTEKTHRAKEIAAQLCDHGKWLTHGRTISIKDLLEMRLKVTNYCDDPELCDAIRRYYTLLKLTFDTTSIYKIYETPRSQIYIYAPAMGDVPIQAAEKVIADLQCNKCKKGFKIQANLKDGIPLDKDIYPFPPDNMFICPGCGNRIDLSGLRMQIELQTKKKIREMK